MRFLAIISLAIALGLAHSLPGKNRLPQDQNEKSGSTIHYPEEKHLNNVKQLTFGGANAEAYFSFDDQRISFQATNWGTECDQIFDFNLKDGVMSADEAPDMVSTGKGKTTCSFFYPDGEKIMYASTHATEAKCPKSPCDKPTDPILKKACKEGRYLWPVDPNFDIYAANRTTGEITDRLASSNVYDAEGVVSPRGDRISFTSARTGDLEIWTMNLDGTEKRQITSETGYDGGSFFSPDGEKLVWRASRPKTPEEIVEYFQLLEANVVSPLEMELFVASADGEEKPRQITELGGSNWSPYWHPSGDKIVFSSNFNNTNTTGFSFNLFMIPETGDESKLEQITFDPTFDSFPMFTHKAPWKLIFASARNSTEPGEINLFTADWVGEVKPVTPSPKKSTTPPPHSTTVNPHQSTTQGAGVTKAFYSFVTAVAAAVLFAK